MQKLGFYTTGEAFTNLVRDLLQSGEFDKVLDILKSGGMDSPMIILFLSGFKKFEGDTREGDLTIVDDDHGLEPMLTGWRTYCNKRGIDLWNFNYFEEDLKSLSKIFMVKQLKELMWREILEDEGYIVYDVPPVHTVHNGVILRDGKVVECGTREHIYLYPVLRSLDIASSSDWTDDGLVIHISGGTVHGNVARSIGEPWRSRMATDAQLQSLFDWREHFREFYGEWRSAPTAVDKVRKEVVLREDHGGKWGNLKFLEEFYPDILLPTRQKTEPESSRDGSWGIRTSPKRSLPGLLESHFGAWNKEEMDALWERHKDVVSDNEINYFYQKVLIGDNGVCHYKGESEFSYSLSSERGAVVSGSEGNRSLTKEQEVQLRFIAQRLFKDLNRQVQLEFVIHNDEVYIVQLRTIKVPAKDTIINTSPEKTIATARTFTEGRVEKVSIDDVLIVDEDAPSEALIGKKALIVRNEVEFSHVLALSQTLRIPSIYGVTSKLDLPDVFTIDATQKTAYVEKPT